MPVNKKGECITNIGHLHFVPYTLTIGADATIGLFLFAVNI
jgi:hypothetical protein